MNDAREACGFCGGHRSRPLYATYGTSGERYLLRACIDCGAVFLSPRPTAEALRHAYDQSYYGAGEQKFADPVQRVIERFRAARVRRMAQLVPPPAAVLDIGCGDGSFAARLIRRGYTVLATELPGPAADRAASIRDLKLHTAELTETTYPERFFDLVTMWHVVEHLTEPKRTLAIIGRILKPGGFLVLSLPNIASWQARLFRGHWLHLDPPRHLFLLPPDELKRQVEGLGFRWAGTRFLSLEQNVFGYQQSLLNWTGIKRDLLYETLKGNAAYARDSSRSSLMLQKLYFAASFPLFAAVACLEAACRRGGTMELTFRRLDDGGRDDSDRVRD